MALSARNHLKGEITEVILGTVTALITVKVVDGKLAVTWENGKQKGTNTLVVMPSEADVEARIIAAQVFSSSPL